MADNWQAISGYASNNYSDTMIFEVDGATKKLQKISGQTLIAGEQNSQYIRFMMPRYWDGIDVSEKSISIVYGLAGQYYGETAAISAERTDDSLRFGWVVPQEACCIAGTLLFVLVIKDSTYVLKSQITDVPVLKSINLDDVIPEPSKETWYKDFQKRVEITLSDAENAVSEAHAALEQAQRYVGAPMVARTAAAMEDTDRIYVYTGSESGYTNGHWYYYDGSAWADGGVYNSVAVDTDTTLTIAGKAADSKKTGDEITSLKEDLNAQIDGIYNDLDAQIPAWEQGTLSTNSGGEPSTDADNRCRTNDYKKIESLIIGIYIKDGYKANVFVYSGTTVASYESNIGWKTNQIRLYGLSGKYVRFIIAHTDDTALGYSDVPADALEVVLYDPTDKILTKSGKAADAKVVGDFVSKITLSNTIYPTWQTKTINGSSGAETDNPRRLSTIEFIESIGLPISVSCDSGYRYSLRYYTDAASASIFGSTDWMTSEHVVPITDGQYFKVVVSKTDDTNIVLSESTAIHIGLGGYTDYNLTQHNKAADAKVVGEKIQALEKITGNDIIGRNNPAEMILKLQQLNQIPRVESHTYGNKPLCLLHFSDIHNDQVRLQNIVDFAGYYTDYIDDVVNTGDTVYYRAADGLSAWENVSGTEAILNTIGNHDTRVDDTWIGLTEAESYNMYIAPYISNWNVTDYSTGHCYYYKDYATEKVRLIILDIMHQTTDQLNWFVSALASAKQNEYHVLVGVHSRAHWNFDSYDVTWDDKKIVSGYAAGYRDTSGTHYPENLSNDYADAVDAFITDGGYFVAWIHGHTHFKMFAKLSTHPNQLDVSVANAGIVPFARTYVDARIDNSKSEDSFNVLAIDTTSKILRIASVGSTYDRIMRHHETISYNYETHELLYSR